MLTKTQTITSWNGAAQAAADEIEKNLPVVASWFTTINTKGIRHEFEHISGPYFAELVIVENEHARNLQKKDIAMKWTTLGAMALIFAKENSLEIPNEHLVKILVRKQTDYGHYNIAKYGRQGLIIRVHDKIARLENLVAKNEIAKNEPIEDTLLDIAGYAAIGIMWESGTFLLPLE